jgi:hypothetical protein
MTPPRTLNNELLTYCAAVEAGREPKTLIGAFAAGARAALELSNYPFICSLCADKIAEIEREIDELKKPTQKSEAQKHVKSEPTK